MVDKNIYLKYDVEYRLYMVVIWMENKNCEIFWNASIDEIKNGYVCSDGEIRCLVCGERFEQGQIYQIDSKFYDASKAVQIHIKKDHGSMPVSYTHLDVYKRQK